MSQKCTWRFGFFIVLYNCGLLPLLQLVIAHSFIYVYTSYWHYIQNPEYLCTRTLFPYTTHYSHNTLFQFKNAFIFAVSKLQILYHTLDRHEN